MDRSIIDSILNSVDNILATSASREKLNNIYKRNVQKPHFIPIRYRILGGILQSMNIQFGNFLENVISNIVAINKDNDLLPESGKKNLNFKQSRKATEYIDRYIADCQSNIYSDKEIKMSFDKCLANIRKLVLKGPFDTIKHDIDLFFYSKLHGVYIYCEIKYNDDHDTGKFVDINRKFLLTFSILTAKYGAQIWPYIFYFTPKRMKGNPYIPECNIFRGGKFFEQFTAVEYTNIDESFKNISKSLEIDKKFNALAHNILYNPNLPF